MAAEAREGDGGCEGEIRRSDISEEEIEKMKRKLRPEYKGPLITGSHPVVRSLVGNARGLRTAYTPVFGYLTTFSSRARLSAPTILHR
jgi:hypothetical protein